MWVPINKNKNVGNRIFKPHYRDWLDLEVHRVHREGTTEQEQHAQKHKDLK